MKVLQPQVRKLVKCPADMGQVIKSENKLQDLGFVEFVSALESKDKKMVHNSEIKYFIPWREGCMEFDFPEYTLSTGFQCVTEYYKWSQPK